MKEKLKVFGIELLFLIIILIVFAGVAWLLFGNKYPFEFEMIEAKTYEKINTDNYKVSVSRS